jgi:hypothetical protein
MKKTFKQLLGSNPNRLEQALITTAVALGIASCAFGSIAIFYYIIIKL